MTGNASRCDELTFARFIMAPENASAHAAVQRLLAGIGPQPLRRAANPLVLHGPAGTGKTHLAAALVAEVVRRSPSLAITVLPASEWADLARTAENSTEEGDQLAAARHCDLLVVEDVHHLPARACEALVQVFDFL